LNVWQAVCLLLVGNHSAGRNVLAGGNFYILDESVHHDDAACPYPGIEDRGAEADEAAVADVGRTVNQGQVSNTSLPANPDGILLAVIADNSPRLESVHHDSIFNAAAFSQGKRGAGISADGSTRCNSHPGSDSDITDKMGKGVD
jgi:hypothetical protein